jgi:cell wall-associated NlpC family hydrolase
MKPLTKQVLITNEQIVAQARTWLGTKYHHQGRLKKGAGHKGGADCVGLVLGVADELGIRDYRGEALLSSYDVANYSILPKGQWMLKLVTDHIKRIPLKEADIGDVLIMRFTDDPQHLGIMSDYPQGGPVREGAQNKPTGLIHCYSRSRCVVEQPLTEDTWKHRAVAAARFNRTMYG